jgi:hypothetical protein
MLILRAFILNLQQFDMHLSDKLFAIGKARRGPLSTKQYKFVHVAIVDLSDAYTQR